MNLPNKLSLLRIIMVPLFVIAYFLPFDCSAFLAFGLFVVAALTDFLDGYIARKYNLVTDLGKLLDPIADKILVCAALFCVLASNPLRYTVLEVPQTSMASLFGVSNGRIVLAVCGLLVLSRELIIDVVRMIAASKGKVVQANVYGKIKTILLDIALPVLVVMEGLARLVDVWQFVSAPTPIDTACAIYDVVSIACFVLLACAIAMTVVSGVVYLIQNRKVFLENTKD